MSKVIELNNDNFEETVKNGISLVDFWAEWCGPCKMQKPIIEELADKTDGAKICSIDTDQNQELAGKYNVMSIPTLILFKDGQVVKQAVGLQSIDQLEQLITSAS